MSVTRALQMVGHVAHCEGLLREQMGTGVQPVFYLPLCSTVRLVWTCVCPA